MKKTCLLVFTALIFTMLVSCKIDPDATYNVIYHGNGYTYGFPPEDRYEYKSGEEATVKGKNTLIRDGYEFQNWSTNAQGTGSLYSEGDTITIKNRNILLFAVWIEKP